MGDFGHIAIFMTMVLSALGGGLILGAERPKSIKAGEGFLLAAAVSAMSTLFILVFLLLNHDFRIEYVHGYSDRNMGLGYLITAVWGGQAGSLLFWAVLQTFYTAAVVLFAKSKPRIALGFLSALQVYFFGLVLFHSDPFAPLGRMPTTGLGMNPLLLNPYMALHPPTLFLGFVGFSVPVAYTFAALAEHPEDDDWMVSLRPFILFAWLFLSVGNLLGMVWAYQELGWGGYWGWDPVENASFMPWLTATALLHTSMLQKSKRLFRVLNPALAIITFALIVFGTFITRSGVIQSVHAFAEATVGPYLLALIVFLVSTFILLAVFNRRALRSEPAPEGLLTKENLFLVTAWLLLISTAFIWIGTMAPLFTELLKNEKVASTPAFFNQWMVPLGLAILAALTVCSTLGRKFISSFSRESMGQLFKSARRPIAAGITAAAGGTAIMGYKGVAPLVGFFLLGMAVFSILRETGKIIAAALEKGGPGLTAARRRRLGAHLVHLAVTLLFLGFTGSAYTEETARVMNPGDRLTVGDFELEFTGLRRENDFRRFALFGDLLVRKDGWTVGTYAAARQFFHSHPKQPTSEVAIRTRLSEDLFMILGRIDEETGATTIRVVINPLVAWIWIGGMVLILGTAVGFAQRRRRKEAARPDRGAVRRVLYLLLPIIIISATAAWASPTDTVLTVVGLTLIGTVLLLGNALYTLAESLESP